MLHFCFYLQHSTEEEKYKLIIAACFHDLGLWTEKTVDYLPPSIVLARDYLQQINLEHWSTEIEQMIDMHPKVTEYKNNSYPLVEVIRKAGFTGLPPQFITDLFSASCQVNNKQQFLTSC